jgi:Na+/glutamate symporter
MALRQAGALLLILLTAWASTTLYLPQVPAPVAGKDYHYEVLAGSAAAEQLKAVIEKFDCIAY